MLSVASTVVTEGNAGAVSLYWAVAEPWSTAEPTKGDGAWERVDSPVVAAIATV